MGITVSEEWYVIAREHLSAVMPCELMTKTMNRKHDTTRHNTTRHDTTRHDTTRHDTTRHDTTRHDTTRHDTVGEYDAPRAFISWRATLSREKKPRDALGRRPKMPAANSQAAMTVPLARRARRIERNAIDPTIASVTPVVVERHAQVAREGRDGRRVRPDPQPDPFPETNVLASAYARVPERVRGYR